jgi:division protein CdvB (Snf7/Vps24/ESCRT-III family)
MATSKARQTVKQLAVKGDVKSARILAKEVVRSNKQKDRLSVSKARLGSIGTQLSQQMGSSSKIFDSSTNVTPFDSNDQGHWLSAKVDRDHEVIQCFD